MAKVCSQEPYIASRAADQKIEECILAISDALKNSPSIEHGIYITRLMGMGYFCALKGL